MAIVATALTTAAVLAFLRWLFYPQNAKVIPSPLRSVLPKLPPDQVAQLDYTPDIFPGARDVMTPYGSIRVYEFGPVTGRKILMVHGITTTCQTLGRVARQLVDCAGCRVMLFDLFGRGFTDGVGDLPHDARLYCTQMLCALASSPLPWTGDRAFDLLGYSMGGGVAVHFAAAFPNLLNSLILLAPAGLIRPERFGVAARLIFTSGIIPERVLSSITRRRLRRPLASGAKAKMKTTAVEAAKNSIASAVEESTKPLDIAVTEVIDEHSATVEAQEPEAQGSLWSMQVGRYVRWMLTHHDGFVSAFMGCIRDAPLIGQEEAWNALARLVKGDPDRKDSDKLPLCIVLGRHDDVVDAQDYEVDVLPLFGGHGPVLWELVPGGHEFPMTYSRPVVRAIFKFWGESEVAYAKLDAEEAREAAMSTGNGKPHASGRGENGAQETTSACKPAGVETAS